MELKGNEIKGFIDDVLYGDFTDTDLSTGKIGLMVMGEEARFDDVLVKGN